MGVPAREAMIYAGRGHTAGRRGSAAVAGLLLLLVAAPATAWDQSSAEATLWQLLNGDRVNNGLPPLAQHSTLVSLARWRSKDMVDRDYLSHTILGTDYQVDHWYDEAGLVWTSADENIGWNAGYADADSPVKIHEGFMASPEHRAIILNPAWTHGAVGAYGADGATWGGKVRDIRMYTELFVAMPTPVPTPSPAPEPAWKATPAPTAAVQATPEPLVEGTQPPTWTRTAEPEQVATPIPSAADAGTSVATPRPSPRLQEDDPGWDCRTRETSSSADDDLVPGGNRVCGDPFASALANAPAVASTAPGGEVGSLALAVLAGALGGALWQRRRPRS